MDIWTIVAYGLAVVFPMAVVAALRAKAVKWGQNWLDTGRFAVVAVWVLAFSELLIAGRFEALNNAADFVELLKTASTVAAAAVGTHTAGKTISG